MLAKSSAALLGAAASVGTPVALIVAGEAEAALAIVDELKRLDNPGLYPGLYSEDPDAHRAHILADRAQDSADRAQDSADRAHIHADRAEASCDYGVLSLRLPKAETARPRRIGISGRPTRQTIEGQGTAAVPAGAG